MENSEFDDELDAIESFDSVINSFDDMDGKYEEITQPRPGRAAQSHLESLFVRPDADTEISKDLATEPTCNATNLRARSAVDDSEHETSEAQSRLDNPESKTTGDEDRPAEDVRGAVKRHSAAAHRTSEE
jgi:hypothetical protein